MKSRIKGIEVFAKGHVNPEDPIGVWLDIDQEQHKDIKEACDKGNKVYLCSGIDVKRLQKALELIAKASI